MIQGNWITRGSDYIPGSTSTSSLSSFSSFDTLTNANASVDNVQHANYAYEMWKQEFRLTLSATSIFRVHLHSSSVGVGHVVMTTEQGKSTHRDSMDDSVWRLQGQDSGAISALCQFDYGDTKRVGNVQLRSLLFNPTGGRSFLTHTLSLTHSSSSSWRQNEYLWRVVEEIENRVVLLI